jgi:hypothetical protein
LPLASDGVVENLGTGSGVLATTSTLRSTDGGSGVLGSTGIVKEGTGTGDETVQRGGVVPTGVPSAV